MGLHTFAENNDNDAVQTKAMKIAELKKNIQKAEAELPKFRAKNDKYFSLFWKMKSDRNNLSHEENPSSAIQIRIKELDKTIRGLEEVFKNTLPQQNLEVLEKNLQAQKSELEHLTMQKEDDTLNEKNTVTGRMKI